MQPTPAILQSNSPDEKEKAEVLGSYFQSIYTEEETRSLELAAYCLRSEKNSESLEAITFTPRDVHDELQRINVAKSSGPDQLPGQLLKEGAEWIAEPLSQLFNKSMATGILAGDWTITNITPIHKKKNDKHSPGNYRPISLTSLVVKIAERIIHRKMSVFLEANGKLNPNQHGFRQKHSCQTQLLETVHQWANIINAGQSTHAVFIDFSKAFDTVPHERLLLKLDHVGMRGPLLRWIRGFLTNRKQRVLIDGSCSDWKRVPSGVPQGSILGPLLFLVYIDDISTEPDSPCRLFADDCVIFRKVTSAEDCSLLQTDLSAFIKWTETWQLRVNLSKCKALRITNKWKKILYTYSLAETLTSTLA